jgi:GntR family phosphonate transport system transcriptional regulator
MMTRGEGDGAIMLDEPDSGIARWRRIADDLKRAIADGTIRDRAPAESELAERYGVNRHTVRRALSVLNAEGLLRTERGKGTFVNPQAPRLSYPITARTRFSENLARQARSPAGRLIRADRVAADGPLSAALGCRPGAPLHRLETLHVADGVPLSVATCHFSAERFPGIVAAYAETGSITEALKREGCADYRRRETRISAGRISPSDAEHFGLGPDAIILLAVAIDVDLENRPIQAIRTRFAADRMELLVETGSEPS